MARKTKKSGPESADTDAPNQDKSTEVEALSSDFKADDDDSGDGMRDESLDESLDDVLIDGDAKASGEALPETPSQADAEVGDHFENDTPSDDASDAPPDGTIIETDVKDVEAETSMPDAAQDGGSPTEEAVPASAIAAVPPQVIQKQGPGFLPLVLGGLIAGLIGYGVATYVTPQPEIDMSRIDALEAQLAEARSTAEAERAAIGDMQGGLREDVDATRAELAALQEAQTGIITAQDGTAQVSDDVRAAVQTLLNRVTEADATLTDVGERVTVLEGRFDEAVGAAASVTAGAEAMARQAAKNQIALALESGAPFSEQVEILGDVPPELGAAAADGVATVAELGADFPELSRNALRASRSSEESAGLGSLFRDTFNPRSLEPREGDDPDAVLSRAEAAVRDGDIAKSLTELEALPADGQAVLSDWMALAQTRAAALAAADDYLQDE